MNKVSWLVLLATMAGCGQAPEFHPWQSLGDAFSFEVNTTRWTPVEARHLGRVAAEHVGEACALLTEAEAVEITPDRARQMCPAAKFDFSGSVKPFLIRGVSYSTPPAYSLVRIDRELGWIYLFQATWNGEIYIPGLRFTPGAAPIVVLLESRPARVVAVAQVGGDTIFRADLRDAWRE